MDRPGVVERASPCRNRARDGCLRDLWVRIEDCPELRPEVAPVRHVEVVAARDEVEATVLHRGIVEGDPDRGSVVGIERPPWEILVELRRGAVGLLDEGLIEIDPHRVDALELGDELADGSVLDQRPHRRADQAQVHSLIEDARLARRAVGRRLDEILRDDGVDGSRHRASSGALSSSSTTRNPFAR